MQCLFTYRQLPSFAHFYWTSYFCLIAGHPHSLMTEEIWTPSGASGQDSFQGPFANLKFCVFNNIASPSRNTPLARRHASQLPLDSYSTSQRWSVFNLVYYHSGWVTPPRLLDPVVRVWILVVSASPGPDGCILLVNIQYHITRWDNEWVQEWPQDP